MLGAHLNMKSASAGNTFLNGTLPLPLLQSTGPCGRGATQQPNSGTQYSPPARSDVTQVSSLNHCNAHIAWCGCGWASSGPCGVFCHQIVSVIIVVQGNHASTGRSVGQFVFGQRNVY